MSSLTVAASSSSSAGRVVLSKVAQAAIQAIQHSLVKHANPNRATNSAKYFKHVIKFHGLESPKIQNTVFLPVYNGQIKSKISIPEQVHMARQLLSSTYFEEKYCAISLLNKNVKSIVNYSTISDTTGTAATTTTATTTATTSSTNGKRNKDENEDTGAHRGDAPHDEDRADGNDSKSSQHTHYVTNVMHQLAHSIDNHVYDWATCDTLSSRVICELLKLQPLHVVPIVREWKNASDHHWRQRAACVSFVKVARLGQHNDTIIDICETCIRNQERFVQLGCGWVLRELSLSDTDRVVRFITSHYDSFTREGLRYAIEKMSPELRSQLLRYKPGTSIIISTMSTQQSTRPKTATVASSSPSASSTTERRSSARLRVKAQRSTAVTALRHDSEDDEQDDDSDGDNDETVSVSRKRRKSE